MLLAKFKRKCASFGTIDITNGKYHRFSSHNFFRRTPALKGIERLTLALGFTVKSCARRTHAMAFVDILFYSFLTEIVRH